MSLRNPNHHGFLPFPGGHWIDNNVITGHSDDPFQHHRFHRVRTACGDQIADFYTPAAGAHVVHEDRGGGRSKGGEHGRPVTDSNHEDFGGEEVGEGEEFDSYNKVLEGAAGAGEFEPCWGFDRWLLCGLGGFRGGDIAAEEGAERGDYGIARWWTTIAEEETEHDMP